MKHLSSEEMLIILLPPLSAWCELYPFLQKSMASVLHIDSSPVSYKVFILFSPLRVPFLFLGLRAGPFDGKVRLA